MRLHTKSSSEIVAKEILVIFYVYVAKKVLKTEVICVGIFGREMLSWKPQKFHPASITRVIRIMRAYNASTAY